MWAGRAWITDKVPTAAQDCLNPGFYQVTEKCMPILFKQLLGWRRKWQPTPIFLPGKFHGLRSLVGYSPQGRKESDTTERPLLLSLWGSFCYLQLNLNIIKSFLWSINYNQRDGNWDSAQTVNSQVWVDFPEKGTWLEQANHLEYSSQYSISLVPLSDHLALYGREILGCMRSFRVDWYLRIRYQTGVCVVTPSE